MNIFRKMLGQFMTLHAGLLLVSSASCLKNRVLLLSEGDTYVLRRGTRQIRIARRHLIYAISLAQHFEIYFSQVLPNDNKGKLEVDYSRPRLQTLANGLQFELPSMPEESTALDAYFRFHRPQEGELVFDVGAYCGISAFGFSQAVGPTGRVVAFEPDPLNVEILRRNLERQKLSNVTVAQIALSDKNGQSQFYSDGNLGSSLAMATDRPPLAASTTVRTATLEQACAEFGIPSFIKIDAEGSEIEILSAGKDFIRSHPMHLVIDTDHTRDGVPTTHASVEEILRMAGYRTVSEPDSGGFMTTWATPNELESSTGRY